MVESLLLVTTLTWLWASPRSLRTHASEQGLVSLALARTPSRARRIRLRWKRLGRLSTARRTLLWEQVLIVLYAVTLLLGVVLAIRLAASRDALSDARDDILRVAPWIVGLAVLCDLLENAGSLWMLHRATAHPLLTAATWNFALLKFLGLIALIGGTLVIVAFAVF